MRIAIDISALSNDHKDRGIGVYAKSLIESLQKYESHHSYHFFTRKQNIPKNVDLVHYPSFDFFFLTLPFFHSKKTIVTIHDLIPIIFPQHFPRGVKGELIWQMQKASVRRVSRVIVDSECTKRDVSRYIGLGASRIDVAYLAPPEDRKRVEDTTVLRITQEKFQLLGSFILYVGDVNWNKNVLGLIAAYELLPEETRSVLPLVLVGQAFLNESKEAHEIRSRVAQSNATKTIRLLGHVTNEELSGLYTLAKMTAVPSIYEGFGLPLLEAMHCGCPVVSVNSSSLTEIAGPAILVNQLSSKAIADGILNIFHMNALQYQKLSHLGVQWAAGFTWKKTARQVVTSYEKVFA